MRACVHELDVVRLRVAVPGETPEGMPATVDAGTQATVILEPRRGSRLVQLEVVDPDTGEPRVFAAADRDAFDVIWRRHGASAATA